MDERVGVLKIYSNGHQYVISDIGENAATILIDSFGLYQKEGAHALGQYEEDLADDYDYIISLRYACVDALVWEAA